MTTNLPMHTFHQQRYPRLRGYDVGDDGEVTVHLCLGLPCCGLDLLIEHPPTMTALELYQIAGEFFAMHERVKALPAFNVCTIDNKGETDALRPEVGRDQDQAEHLHARGPDRMA